MNNEKWIVKNDGIFWLINKKNPTFLVFHWLFIPGWNEGKLWSSHYL